MKRALIFILLIALIIVLSGCSSKGDSADDVYFRKLKNISHFGGYHHSLWYDTTNGVVYMLTFGTYVSSFTPLFNADGTLKTYDDYIEVK